MSSVYEVLGSAKRGGDAVLQTRNYMKAAAELDGQLSARNAAYGRASSRMKSSKVGQAMQKTVPVQDKLFGYASDVVTVAGLGLSAVALPNMAKKTATSARELITLIDDPNATNAQRLDKAETLTRSAAGTIFSAQGVYMGAKGTLNILGRFKPLGRLFETIGNSRFLSFMKVNPVGRAIGALLPVADGAVFIGEVIATNRTMKDPLATPEAKARKVLDLGLAGLKTAFWIFPQVRMLRTIYTAASYGQLGLTLWDFRKTLGPKLVEAGKAIAWGVAHPKEGLAALGNGIKNFATGLFTNVGSAATSLFQRVAHPAETWNTMVKGVRAINETAKTPPSQAAAPAPAPTAPVAPVVAAPVVAAPVTPVAPVAEPVVPVAPPAPVAEIAAPAAAPVTDPSVDAAYQQAVAQLGTP